MPTFPLYVKRLGDYNGINGEFGSKTYHLLEIESGHTEDGFMEFRKILNNFSKITGYKWRLEILSTIQDTMLMFGLE